MGWGAHERPLSDVNGNTEEHRAPLHLGVKFDNESCALLDEDSLIYGR